MRNAMFQPAASMPDHSSIRSGNSLISGEQDRFFGAGHKSRNDRS
jgi:hypothetical protein